MPRRVGHLLPAILLWFGARALPAQGSHTTPRPRVAVVLSGGAAKGLAHIGVLRVLEAEGIVPDVVTGASIGALVGGLYAIGYSPATLDSLVTSLEWASYFRDAPEGRFLSLDRRFSGERTVLALPLERGKVTLPSGAISGQRISELLARLTWPVQTERDFRRLPKAFVATGTDIETGETIVLDRGSLAEAMRASMSIPSLFSPVRVDGRLLVDGGITRNLPARDARALGADILICSDVADPLFPASRLRSLVDVLLQTVTIYMNASNVAERPLCDVYIRPSTAGLTVASFERAAAWIERGVDAASEARPQLRAIAARVRAAQPSASRAAPTRSDTVQIAAVVVDGVSGAAGRAVRRTLRLPDAGRFTVDQLDAAVKRTYATELFEQVQYRLEARGADTVVVVKADPREQDRLGVGLRYDDTYHTSLLLTARLRNRIGFGSTTQLDLRLGEQLRAGVHHANVGVADSRLVVGFATSHSRTPLPLWDGDLRVAEARVDVTNAAAFVGVALGDRASAGVELKGEHVQTGATVAPFDTTQRRTFASGALLVRWNTFDRVAFPMRGHLLSLRSEHAVGDARFAQHVAHAQVALPLARRVAALGRLTVGASSREAGLPVHYRFMLGGAYPAPLFPETQVAFVGLRPQERSGAAVSRLGGALQWTVRRDVFATVRADIGYAGRTLTLDADAYDTGVGLGIGAATPFGPLELSVGGRPTRGRPHVELSLGYPF